MTLFDPLIVLFSLAGFGNFKCGFGSDGGGFPFLPIIWIGGGLFKFRFTIKKARFRVNYDSAPLFGPPSVLSFLLIVLLLFSVTKVSPQRTAETDLFSSSRFLICFVFKRIFAGIW